MWKLCTPFTWMQNEKKVILFKYNTNECNSCRSISSICCSPQRTTSGMQIILIKYTKWMQIWIDSYKFCGAITLNRASSTCRAHVFPSFRMSGFREFDDHNSLFETEYRWLCFLSFWALSVNVCFILHIASLGSKWLNCLIHGLKCHLHKTIGNIDQCQTFWCYCFRMKAFSISIHFECITD